LEEFLILPAQYPVLRAEQAKLSARARGIAHLLAREGEIEPGCSVISFQAQGLLI